MFVQLPILDEWCDPWVPKALVVNPINESDPQGPSNLFVMVDGPEHGYVTIFSARFETYSVAVKARDEIGSFIRNAQNLDEGILDDELSGPTTDTMQ